MALHHRVWGAVKRSKTLNAIQAVLASLPLLDIITDYVFLVLTFSSDPNQTEKAIAVATMCCLYLSSRLVIVLLIVHYRNDVTIENICYFYCPFTFIHYTETGGIITLGGETDSLTGIFDCEIFEKKWARVLLYVIFLLSIPLVHFAYVCYVVYRQASSHLFQHRDYGPFGPVSFIEISESLPQAVFQTILFWQKNNLSVPWGTTQRVYVLSMIASTIAIAKAIYMYVSRLEVIKQGFGRDRIDDTRLLRAIADNGDLKKFTKVVTRMENQGIDLMMTHDFGPKHLQQGWDVHPFDDDGWTVFFGWCQVGGLLQIESLLSKGVNVDSSDKNGMNGLMYASNHGQNSIVAKLSSLGVDIEAKSKRLGWTALMGASMHGHESTVSTLVSLGADIEAEDNEGQTALMHATRKGHDSIVSTLVSLGADMEAQDNEGKTALMHASRYGYDSIVSTLVSLGADMKAQDHTLHCGGWTALMYASRYGHDSTVSTLVSLGADIEARDNHTRTALMIAAIDGHDSTVSTLVSLGADIEAKDNNGRTALMYASESHKARDSTITKLISLGADIEAKDKLGCTALMIAARYANPWDEDFDSTVSKLVSLGADIETKDMDKILHCLDSLRQRVSEPLAKTQNEIEANSELEDGGGKRLSIKVIEVDGDVPEGWSRITKTEAFERKEDIFDLMSDEDDFFVLNEKYAILPPKNNGWILSRDTPTNPEETGQIIIHKSKSKTLTASNIEM